MEGADPIFPTLAGFDAISCELAPSSREILPSLQAATGMPRQAGHHRSGTSREPAGSE